MNKRRYDPDRDLISPQPLRRGPGHTQDPSTLRPLRDTGLTLGENGPRRPRRRGRSRRRASQVPLLVGMALVVVVLSVAGVVAITRARAGGAPRAEDSPAIAYQLETLPDPTPLFASYRSLQLSLPLLPEDTTAIGFHQASGNDTLRMSSLVPDADMGEAASGKAQLRPAASREGADGISTVLQGNVLRMWRSNRSGKPDTACDVGGAPGTTVYSPVTGVVAHIERYKLYGKYPDYEIHITPDGWPDVDVVLIHVDSLTVREGDRVEGGATAVAHVRKLSDRVSHQLATYTGDGGDHVHMQLNKVEAAGKVQSIGES